LWWGTKTKTTNGQKNTEGHEGKREKGGGKKGNHGEVNAMLQVSKVSGGE